MEIKLKSTYIRLTFFLANHNSNWLRNIYFDWFKNFLLWYHRNINTWVHREFVVSCLTISLLLSQCFIFLHIFSGNSCRVNETALKINKKMHFIRLVSLLISLFTDFTKGDYKWIWYKIDDFDEFLKAKSD